MSPEDAEDVTRAIRKLIQKEIHFGRAPTTQRGEDVKQAEKDLVSVLVHNIPPEEGELL